MRSSAICLHTEFLPTDHRFIYYKLMTENTSSYLHLMLLVGATDLIIDSALAERVGWGGGQWCHPPGDST